MNDRTTRALEALAPHLLPSIHPLEVRAILDDLQDGAQDELLNDLIGTPEAAAIWGVSRQRAHAHIGQLHAKYGYGKLVGNTWIIRRAHVISGAPEAKYKRKERS